MKLITFTFLGLAFALQCENADVFAQEKWHLQSLNIFVGVMEFHGGIRSDSTTGSFYFNLSNKSTLRQVKKNGDSIIIPLPDSDIYYMNNQTTEWILVSSSGNISFNFNPHGFISNFLISKNDTGSRTKPGLPYAHTYSVESHRSIFFSSLEYETQIVSSDTTIIRIELKGEKCKQAIEDASYNDILTDSWTAKFPESETTSTQSFRLSDDTTLYSCSVTFLVENLGDIVHGSNLTSKIFNIFTSLPDHSIHFSFPISDHSETLAIYDVLGREVKRIDIPSGASEYDLARDQSAIGYYFARLGNMEAKFVVF